MKLLQAFFLKIRRLTYFEMILGSRKNSSKSTESSCVFFISKSTESSCVFFIRPTLLLTPYTVTINDQNLKISIGTVPLIRCRPRYDFGSFSANVLFLS